MSGHKDQDCITSFYLDSPKFTSVYKIFYVSKDKEVRRLNIFRL